MAERADLYTHLLKSSSNNFWRNLGRVLDGLDGPEEALRGDESSTGGGGRASERKVLRSLIPVNDQPRASKVQNPLRAAGIKVKVS